MARLLGLCLAPTPSLLMCSLPSAVSVVPRTRRVDLLLVGTVTIDVVDDGSRPAVRTDPAQTEAAFPGGAPFHLAHLHPAHTAALCSLAPWRHLSQGGAVSYAASIVRAYGIRACVVTGAARGQGGQGGPVTTVAMGVQSMAPERGRHTRPSAAGTYATNNKSYTYTATKNKSFTYTATKNKSYAYTALLRSSGIRGTPPGNVTVVCSVAPLLQWRARMRT